MVALTAAVVVVGALCLLNLVLTLGVIRRLREHTELLSSPAASGAPVPILGAGEQVGEFEAKTSDGEMVTRDSLSSATLVGFFSPDCFACKEQLPRFVTHAGQRRGGRADVLVAVVGKDVEDLVQELEPVAQVVVEADGGPMSRAFSIKGFPAFCRVDDEGTVTGSGFDLQAFIAVHEG